MWTVMIECPRCRAGELLRAATLVRGVSLTFDDTGPTPDTCTITLLAESFSALTGVLTAMSGKGEMQ